MYDNIGNKIKILAKVTFVLCAISSLLAGIVLMATSEYMVVAGLIIMVVGSLFSWIASWFMYGFGELIEKTSAIERNTRGGGNSSVCVKDNEEKQNVSSVKKVDVVDEIEDRNEKIKKLFEKGLITEEEYQRAISKQF